MLFSLPRKILETYSSLQEFRVVWKTWTFHSAEICIKSLKSRIHTSHRGVTRISTLPRQKYKILTGCKKVFLIHVSSNAAHRRLPSGAFYSVRLILTYETRTITKFRCFQLQILRKCFSLYQEKYWKHIRLFKNLGWFEKHRFLNDQENACINDNLDLFNVESCIGI